MRRVAIAALGLLACAGAALSACGSDRDAIASTPRLVLLYVPCTVNREFLSPYDREVDYTPNLARLAAGGVVFEQHWSEAGQSGVAYASIFSGAQAPVHEVFSHPSPIPEAVDLIFEAFSEAGYEVFFWGGHGLASAKYDYAQGVPPENVFKGALRADRPEFRALLNGLASDPERRALVVTNFTITHAPYSPRNIPRFCGAYPHRCAARDEDPARFEGYARLHKAHYRELANNFPETVARLGLSAEEIYEMARALELLYESRIHALDRDFGAVMDLVEAAGLLDDGLIAFTADHGETLYRENALFKWTHGWELAPEVLRVPWIVRAPSRSPGRFRGVSRSIDVFPTLAGLAGSPLGETTATGVDLSPALTGASAPPSLEALSHTVVQHPQALRWIRDAALWLRFHGGIGVGGMWVSLFDGDLHYKYRNLDGERWGFQAFDLHDDPREERDLYDPEDDRHRAAADELILYREKLISAWKASEVTDLDDEATNTLRELGYIE